MCHLYTHKKKTNKRQTNKSIQEGRVCTCTWCIPIYINIHGQRLYTDAVLSNMSNNFAGFHTEMLRCLVVFVDNLLVQQQRCWAVRIRILHNIKYISSMHTGATD